MADNWISKMVGRHSAPDPFEADGIEASDFMREMVLGVHKACAERDFATALKWLCDHGTLHMSDAERKAAAANNHARYIHDALTEVAIFEHRRPNAHLEYTRVSYYGARPSAGTRYMGVLLHHRASGPLAIWWFFGGDFAATAYPG